MSRLNGSNQPSAAGAQEQIFSALFSVWLLHKEAWGLWRYRELGYCWCRKPKYPGADTCTQSMCLSRKNPNNPTLPPPSFHEGKIETLEIVLLNISPGWTWSRSWVVIKDAWRELRHWRRREKRARKIIYFDGDFCNGFILRGHRDPVLFKRACGKCKRSICSPLESCVGPFSVGLHKEPSTSTSHFGDGRDISTASLEMAGRTWRLGAKEEQLAVGYFGKGRRLLGSSKGLI